MRKEKYLTAVMLATALSISFGVPAWASGWAQENGTWVYYGVNDTRVTNAWRQGADGAMRYLDSNGQMAVSSWVDDDNSYVDENGIRISGKWLQVENSSKASGYDYYYFNQSGKCVKSKWEKIDGKWYYFDEKGVMQTGWIDDNRYYSDENGVMLTGWQKLDPPEDEKDSYKRPAPWETDDGKKWYYFGSTGKKVLPDEKKDNISQKKIGGSYYCLDEYGAMQTGWVCVTGSDSDNIADYRYVDDNGQVKTGWYSINPPEDLQGQYDHDVEWFYFNSKGVPKTGPERGSAKKNDFSKIGGNTYLFDERGVPVYGVQKVYSGSDGDSYTAYYFGDRSQSCLLKGKFTLDEAGDQVNYYFAPGGEGYTGVKDNSLYYMGKLQKADSGDQYTVFSIPQGGHYNNYVVNTAGKIVKNTTVKDKAGTKYKTNSSGILVKEDDETVSGGDYTEPREPEWSAWSE